MALKTIHEGNKFDVEMLVDKGISLNTIAECLAKEYDVELYQADIQKESVLVIYKREAK